MYVVSYPDLLHFSYGYTAGYGYEITIYVQAFIREHFNFSKFLVYHHFVYLLLKKFGDLLPDLYNLEKKKGDMVDKKCPHDSVTPRFLIPEYQKGSSEFFLWRKLGS